MTITSWIDQASCTAAHPYADWFAEEGTLDLITALHICKTKCPVKKQCLTHAMDNEERHGVWGGATSRQRMLLARKRGQHLDLVLTPRRY